MRIDCLAETMVCHGGRPALWIGGHRYTYVELLTAAANLRRVLAAFPADASVGILTGRSLAAYAGLLGTILSGRTYVPLNIDYPAERLRRICGSARPAALVGGPEEREIMATLCGDIHKPRVAVTCDASGRVSVTGTPDAGASHGGSSGVRPAYVMFTSGTTGDPKGIAISRANLSAYLTAIEQLFDFKPTDRFSQFFNLSFDLSVHDVFVTWMTGGCLFVPNAKELMDPVSFARTHELSVWFSVPSAASLAMRFRKLQPNCMPSLRHGLFCGEALSGEVAKAFARAAPNAVFTNLYGPTEATIAITAHSICWNDLSNPDGIPIGHPFPGQEALVLRSDGAETGLGEVGELWLSGTQVAAGYTNDPTRSAETFRRFTRPGRAGRIWYGTGDLVERHPEDGLIYRGRVDDQIKLNGHRIELTEVEETLRKAAGTPLGIVAPWPPGPQDNATRLIAVVSQPSRSESEILDRMRLTLPGFMIPSSIRAVKAMSFNKNGKLDRKATLERLATS